MEGLLAIPDVKDKVNALQLYVDKAVASSDGSSLIGLVSRVLAEDVSTQVTKSVLTHFAQAIKALNATVLEDVANQSLMLMKQSQVNLDEASYLIRDLLFDYYVQCGQYADAAATLSAVNLDSTARPFADEEKADIYIKCAETYLEADMAVEAEVFMNKSSPFINAVVSWTVQLRYKVTFARVQDANRKFVEAALRYYELSTLENENVVQEDLLVLLAKAITCAILSKAGVQRTRILALIGKDERLSDLEHNPKYSVHAAIVQKMFREQIIKADELKQLEESLADHQKALTADGSTVLQKAVIEHNMIAASRIYANIHFGELANILLVDERRAEKIAATMISENRLKACIDQVERALVFEDCADPATAFDTQIANICKDVSEFVDLAREVFPSLAPAC